MKRPVTPALFVALAVHAAACGGGSAPPGGPSGTPTAAPDATLGPAGGTVTSSDHHAVLTVPPGALSATTGLTLRATTQVPLDPHVVDHTTYEIGPPGTTFAAPATLALDFDRARAPSGVDETELRLQALAGGAWQPVAGAATARGADATGTVGAAGIYGVRWIGPGASCSGPRDGDFDFWLGSWDFHQGNLPAARNEITKEGGGCLVEEHYEDPAGVRGRSVSLFSRADGRWHQTYIDSAGGRIVLVGGLDGGRMVMFTGPNDRTIWDPLDANTIRYYSERTADGGQSWRVTFDSRYTRR